MAVSIWRGPKTFSIWTPEVIIFEIKKRKRPFCFGRFPEDTMQRTQNAARTGKSLQERVPVLNEDPTGQQIGRKFAD